ncbi:hypothetical protein [Streptomyces sp. WAC08241]|uniref:hypothetical protein n=1 Tax=Streptomyces sp. WAC08241 TaxID=2487421 RepID=UPI000F7B3780|nr:hypothetical protein [Streptomyces sp. WAC08241]RSS38906.1 hypothetical protein EF906_20020 [Streptomyces sp. WAC08241]
MTQICRVGAAAAGMVVVAVLVAGCGGDGVPDAAPGASRTPIIDLTTPEPTDTDTGLPFSTEDPYATEEPTETPGPEADFDRLVEEKGWVLDAYNDGSPSTFVLRACAALDEGIELSSPPEYLVDMGYLEGDKKHVLQAGVPKLCPKWTSAVKQAVSGDYDRWYGNGTYVVSSKAIAGEREIPPGTYQTTGKLDDCYWERTSESGEIIDNNFATSARKITVTIRSSDGQFTTERCGTWKPVK